MAQRRQTVVEQLIDVPERPVRSSDDRVLAGVCGGLGWALGVDANVLRLALAVLTIANGSGIVLYLAALVLMPHVEVTAADETARERSGERAVGVALVTLALLIMFGHLGLLLPDEIVWASAVAAVGMALVWARTDAADRTKGMILRS